ncbi:sensor histidine kinase [Candidatus Magnetaquicoccus inordinatus]|uniref:sensor histidine kinase n=1 Tax=Candidatus Magnetaquicoccus inordinatus TaxID=2496818 RepID=UPI00102BA598|nr:sensor histidine kinase [Candidatus Magnetaquicoccus inordinatus]
MKGMRSIKAKLLWTLAASLLLMFVLLWWVVSAAVQELTARYLEQRIELEISSILAEVNFDEADGIILDTKQVDALFHFSFSGYYYQISLQGMQQKQILRSLSLGDFILHIPEVMIGQQTRMIIPGPKGQKLLAVVRAIPLREQSLLIAVAEDLTPFEKNRQDFQWLYTLLSLGLLAILLLAHYGAVQQAMSPIQKIQHNVVQLEMGQVNKLSSDVPPEMEKIVDQINRLLLRTEQRLVRSRSTIANLAHALKSPLATLSQMLRHSLPTEDTRLRGELEERLASLHELIERELRRARLADHALSGTLFCPKQSLGDLVRTLKNINFQKNIEVELDFSPGMLLPFDQEDMTEIFGNLLDNAFKWAQGRIGVTLEELEQQFNIRVEDDGPGVEEEEIERLAGRGVRIDESRPGHGLGLAVVRETVEHYGGRLQFARSPALGGLQVEISLPMPSII